MQCNAFAFCKQFGLPDQFNGCANWSVCNNVCTAAKGQGGTCSSRTYTSALTCDGKQKYVQLVQKNIIVKTGTVMCVSGNA